VKPSPYRHPFSKALSPALKPDFASSKQLQNLTSLAQTWCQQGLEVLMCCFGTKVLQWVIPAAAKARWGWESQRYWQDSPAAGVKPALAGRPEQAQHGRYTGLQCCQLTSQLAGKGTQQLSETRSLPEDTAPLHPPSSSLAGGE